MRKYFCVFVWAIVCLNAKSQSFEGSKIGNGIRFVDKDSSFSTQINVRFQTQYSGFLNMETNDYTDQFLIRRYRLKFKGFLYDPRIEYKIELGLSNRDQGDFYNENSGAANIVLDAVLKWHFHKDWQLWIGQTKLPGNRERVISSGQLQFTSRSQLNARYTLDRDIGFQLRHEHKTGQMVLRQMLAISSGEGRNVTVNNAGGYGYTFRTEFLPFGKFASNGDYFGGDLKRESKPKLSIAATYDFNDNNNRERGQLGRFLDTSSDLSTYFIDLMFKYNGFSIMSEYGKRTILSGETSGLDENNELRYVYTGQALNFSTGYVFKNNYEVAARYVYNQPESTSIGQTDNIYELNLTKYIAAHTLKAQLSTSYYDYEDRENEMRFLFLMEIGF